MARTQVTSRTKKTGSQVKTGMILPGKADDPDSPAENMSGAKKDFDKGAHGKSSPAKNVSQDKDKWTDGTNFESSIDEDDDWF